MNLNQLKVEAKSRNINDEPIPEINAPVIKPTPYWYETSWFKSITSKVTNLVKEKINNFSDWVISFVPKSVSKVVNERVELLKEDIKDIYENKNKEINKKKEESELLKEDIKKIYKPVFLDAAIFGEIKKKIGISLIYSKQLCKVFWKRIESMV